MKYVNREDGSSFIMLMITVSVLFILGTSVLSMSFMNYNMKYMDRDLKKTMYYAESGLDQAYSIVGKYVDQAILTASQQADADIASAKNQMAAILERISEEGIAIVNDSIKLEQYYQRYNTYYTALATDFSEQEFLDNNLYLKVMILEDELVRDYMAQSEGCFLQLVSVGTTLLGETVTTDYREQDLAIRHQFIISEQKIIDYSKAKLNQYYKTYFNQATVKQALLEDINNRYVYLDDNNPSQDSRITIQVDRIDDYSVAPNDQFILRQVTSSFVYQDRLNKKLTTDMVIDLPGDHMPVNVFQNKIKVNNNPLWQYGIVSQRDMIVSGSGSKVGIDGNVYAYGTGPSPDDTALNRDSRNFNGVMVKGSNNSLRINGDVITHSYVQIDNGSYNGSLTVENGHVYCDGFVVQEDSVNGRLQVLNGNVYTSDDLELSGRLGAINIQGSYFGYMKGATVYNGTSSIVINTDPLSPVRNLTISGERANLPFNENDTGNGGRPLSGIYIGGVTWINDIFRPLNSLYQSGESVGIKGNYIAYAFPVENPSSKFNSTSLGEDVAVGQSSGLNLYYKYHKGGYVTGGNYSGGSYTVMTAEEKADYFKEVATTEEYQGLINDGSGIITININKYKAAPGIVIGNQRFERVLPNSEMNYISNRMSRDYYYILNFLRHMPETDEQHSNLFGSPSTDNPVSIIRRLRDNKLSGYTKIFTTPINHYSKIGDKSYDYVQVQDGVVGADTDPIKQAVVVQSGVRNILINGSGSGVNAADRAMINYGGKSYLVINADSNGKLQGIIATNGEVRFIGTVNFYGSVIADRNIEISGANVQINNGQPATIKYLSRLIAFDQKLADLFDKDTLPTLGRRLEQIEFVEQVDVSSGKIDALRQNSSQLISYQRWRVEE